MSKPTHFRVQTKKSKTEGEAKSRQPLAVPSEPMLPSRETKLSPAKDADRLKRAYTFDYRMAQVSQTGETSHYTPSPIFDEQGVWRKGAEMLRAQGIDPVQYIRVLFRSLRSMCLFVDTGEANSRARQKRAARDIVAESKRQKHDVKDKHKIYIGLDDWADTRPPTPAQIFSPEYQKQFKQDLENGHKEAAMKAKYQWERLRGRAVNKEKLGGHTREKSCVLALYDETSLRMGALPRYIFAMSLIQVPETSSEQKKWNDKFREVAEYYWQSACIEFMHNEVGYIKAWGKLLPPQFASEAPGFYEFVLEKLKL